MIPTIPYYSPALSPAENHNALVKPLQKVINDMYRYTVPTDRVTAERGELDLSADIVDITYQSCMEVINNV